MRTQLPATLAATALVVSTATLPTPADAVLARLAPTEQMRAAIEPVHDRILDGHRYRYASPNYSYGYPRLDYDPWGIAPRAHRWHPRWRLR